MLYRDFLKIGYRSEVHDLILLCEHFVEPDKLHELFVTASDPVVREYFMK